MRRAKLLTIVLTLSTSIAIMLSYMIINDKLVGKSYNSSTTISQDTNVNKSNNIIKDIITKVSTIQLTKDETANSTDRQEKITATSRSGFHEAITDTAEANTPQTDTITEEITEESVEEVIEEPIEEAKPTYEGVELEYSARYSVCESPLSKSKGATYYNGHKETYYSQKVLPGKGLKMLNNNGRHVADDGTVRDADGFIAVACNYLSKGATIMTSLGPGKVYDTGGMTGKWIDIYVNW